MVAFDKPTKERILDLLTRVCTSGNSRITNAFWAMGTLGVPAYIDQYQKELSRMLISITTFKLSQMLLESMLEAGMSAAESASAWAACNRVGLEQDEIRGSQLDSTFRTRLMKTLVNLQDDMNCGYLHFIVVFRGVELPLDTTPVFRNALRHSREELEALGRSSQAIWGLSCCNIAWGDITPETRWKLNVALRRVGDAMPPQGWPIALTV